MRAREQALDQRESQTQAREQALELRDRALRALAEADEARRDRERLMRQMREANERLVLACLHAEELAAKAGIEAAHSATVEAERRRHEEMLETQLLASENALRASQYSAKTSSRAMDEFLAMLGHELRNPLASIALALELVAQAAADPHKREHRIIGRQVDQLGRLVEDLLDVSRIKSGKIELQREPIEAAELVSRAVETARPLIESQRHALTIDVPPHGLAIDGDVLRLTQVVSNLLTNAAKYTPSGGTIAVTGERRGARVVLRVRDTGIGISEAMLPRIFDVFTQEHQRRGQAPGGLGLGLTIVRSLVELHGGTVTAHSAGLGHGSEFVVELPMGGRRSDEASREPAPPITAAHSVLVIEDDKIMAELMSEALRSVGYNVRTALDAASALSLVAQAVPDVVLIDVDLGGQDAYELAQRVRSTAAPRDVHFIAVTGYGQPADRERSAGARFDDHLVKPVSLAALQRSIDRAIRRPDG